MRIRPVLAALLAGALLGPTAGLAAYAAPPAVAHAPTASRHGGPVPVLVDPVIVPANAPTWVSIYWITTAAVCDFRVTAVAPDASVSYPSNTATYSSFYRDSTLEPGALDYTALRVDARPGALVVPLILRVWYGYGTAYGCHARALRELVEVTLVSPPGAAARPLPPATG